MFKSFLLPILLFSSLLAWTQPAANQIEFEHISIPGTMTSAVADDVIQDSLGMIWVAKLMLHRYDGKKFKSYSTIYPDSVPLNGKEITKLFWDSKDNRLLIGTRNHGLLQFRYEDNRISKFHQTSGIPIINNIARTPDGKIWISSFSSGLFVLANDTLVRKYSLQQISNPTALEIDGQDLWVGGTRAITIIRNGHVRKIISLEDLHPDWVGVTRVSSLHLTREGMWVGTERHGILRFNPITLKTDRYFSPLENPFFSTITRIQKDNQGLIWILTRNNGVALYDPKKNNYTHLLHNQSDNTSISGDVCASILIDRQGIIWVGTSGALNKYNRNKVKFTLYKHDPGNSNSISEDNVRGIYESEDGIVWLATADGYINLLNRKKKTAERIKVTVAGYDKFIAPLFFCEFDNKMLVGTTRGVLQFDRASAQFKFYKPLEDETKGKNSRQLATDGNNLYLQCSGQLLIYQLKEKKLRIITAAEGLTGVSFITLDRDNFLWCGNLGGVARYNPANQTFQKIKIEQDEFRPDSSYFLVLSIEPKEKEVWVNTFNTGIFILSPDAHGSYSVTKRITTKEGLPDNTVYASLSDKHGNKWISTNNGLAMYDSVKQKMVSFSTYDGLQAEEFNRLAFYKNRKGELYFGGIDGLNVFHPDSLKITTSDPKPEIIGMSISKNLSSEDVYEKYFTFINNPRMPQLGHTERNLRFDFFIPDFNEPNRYEVYYRLEPLDASWTKAENQNTALYANLKPGDYTFSVKAINPKGKEQLSTSSFVIMPPFWSTWWFLTLATLGSVFFILVIIRSRIAVAEAEQKRLELLLKERTREIERSNEELENLNRKKDLIFSILSHDLRSPLTTLKGFLGMIIDNSESISKEDLRKYAVSIRNSVTNSLDLIDNTLYWSLSQTGTIQFTPTEVLLNPMFKKIKGLYQLTAEKKQIKFTIEDVNDLAIYGDENMIYVLLRNLTSNAIKFTSAGKAVTLSTTKNSHWVEIKIKDEGVGMSEQEVSKIFTLDNPQVKRGTSSEKGTGLGLILCKKFIEVNQGKLRIHSKEGEGSEFIVSLPLPQH